MAALISSPRHLDTLRKNEEDTWISSEDLNTQSDESPDEGCYGPSPMGLTGTSPMGLNSPSLGRQTSCPSPGQTSFPYGSPEEEAKPAEKKHRKHRVVAKSNSSHSHRLAKEKRRVAKSLSHGAPPLGPLLGNEMIAEDVPHVAEVTRRLSLMGVEQGSVPFQNAMEELDGIMLWRPKKGSFKLSQLSQRVSDSQRAEEPRTDQTFSEFGDNGPY